MYILNYYGSYFSSAKNEIWIILELCEGGSSIDLMYAMGRTYSEKEIACIAKMTLLALKFLHSKNIIHRDIKGANILLKKNGTVKLADFGTGILLKENNYMRSSKKGSPYWMSPQVAGQKEYNTKTDIWSLGISCYELFCGEPPLSEYKPYKVMKIIEKKPRKIVEIRIFYDDGTYETFN